MEIGDTRLFANIRPDERERMTGCMRIAQRVFHAGGTIYRFSALKPKGFLGLVLKGRAALERTDIDGNRFLIETLEPGEVFGEKVAFSDSADALSVRAETDCTVAFVPLEKLTERCDNNCRCHAELLDNLLEIVSDKAMSLSARVAVLANRTIRGRLLYYFSLLARRNNSRTFRLPGTVTWLADYVCSDRSAVSRELAAMKKDGIISGEKGTVVLSGEADILFS